jgi:hypothetical protein
MANQFVFTLMMLPNIIEFFWRNVFKWVYGYSIQILIVTLVVYTLDFCILSYFLYKWFVKGEGDMKKKTKKNIKKIVKVL